MESATTLSWIIFFAVVITLLALDLFLFNKGPKEPSFAASLRFTLFYIAISVFFGAGIWHHMGADHGMEFFTGYAMELSLSLDNIFVISMIFGAMQVPAAYQHRVLFWGVLGVLVLRGILIGVGAALVAKFAIVMALFGLFLVVTGIRMLFAGDEETDIKDNKLLNWMRGHLRITPDFEGQKFFLSLPHPTKPDQKALWVTPLFITLVLVEMADLIFAVDSVPAIFGVTTEPYIVYTSNIFAILGLRSLYFTLQSMVGRFHYLSHALSLVLIFVGIKIIYEHFSHDHVPTVLSLGMVLGLIAAGVVVSLVLPKKAETPKA